MTQDEWKAAFADPRTFNVKVRSRSGKEYWIHPDQLEFILGDGLAYGVPVRPHPRLKKKIVWLQPENVLAP